MRASRRDVLIGLASGLAAPAIAAEKYPVRPVRLISGFPAGGAVDITARVIADWMSSDLGQQVYVEDRGGSGGNIGAQAVIHGGAHHQGARAGDIGRVVTFVDFLRPSAPAGR